MRRLSAVLLAITLTLGLAITVSAKGQHDRYTEHAVKVRQKIEKRRLKERQKSERRYVKSGGGDMRLLIQKQKLEQQKLKDHQKAERDIFK